MIASLFHQHGTDHRLLRLNAVRQNPFTNASSICPISSLYVSVYNFARLLHIFLQKPFSFLFASRNLYLVSCPNLNYCCPRIAHAADIQSLRLNDLHAESCCYFLVELDRNLKASNALDRLRQNHLFLIDIKL